MRGTWCVAALLLAGMACVRLGADTVALDDGSRIQGSLERIAGGKVYFGTGFAGVLVIDAARIASLKTDGSRSFVLKEDREARPVPVRTRPVDLAPADLAAIDSLWAKESENPFLPRRREWSGDVYLDVAGKEGNTDKMTRNLGATVCNKGEYDQLKLYAAAAYSEENDVKSDDVLTIGADYEYARNRHSWYARLEYEEDEMNSLDHRYQGATGYGHYFWKDDRSLLRLRIGLDCTRKEWDGQDSADDSVGLDSNLLFRYSFRDWGVWETSLTYNPAFDDWLDDYRILHESFWELPIHLRIPLALRLGVSHEYYGLTVGDVKHCDTTYFARIVYKW